MRTLLTVAVMLMLLASVPDAQARFRGNHVDDAMLQEAVTVGYSFWAAKGIAPCPRDQLDLRVTEDLPDLEQIGYTAGCVVSIRASLANYAERHPDAEGPRRFLCALVTHELGHTAGLQHTARGVMAPGISDHVPRLCNQWAKVQSRWWSDSPFLRRWSLAGR